MSSQCMIAGILILLAVFIDKVEGGCNFNANQIVDYNKNILDAPLLDMIWCGSSKDNDYNVLVLTDKGTIYRSIDRGFTFQRQTEELHKRAMMEMEDVDIDVGFVNKMQKSPIDNSLIFFLGSLGIHWVTDDCGASFRALSYVQGFKDFLFHPTEKNWVLASAWTKCQDSQPNSGCTVNKELFLTTDLGRNWKKLRGYVVQYSWGKQNAKSHQNIPKERIIWSEEITDQFGNQQTSGWNMKTHMFMSDDLVQSKTMIVNQGNKFLLTQNFLFVAQAQSAEEQQVTLLVSDSNLRVYEFKYTQLQEQLKQHSFTILDSSQGQVFLNVNHYKPNSPMGDILMSDATGSRFSQSLRDNVRDNEGQCDFEKLQGLDGIFIANIFAGKNARRFEELIKNNDNNDDIEVQKSKNKKTSNTNYDAVKQYTETLQKYKQTMITFDKGGIWKPLSPPNQNSFGEQIQCNINENCSLNLHSVSSQMAYGPVYSTENSLGIILGTGNVGQFLENRSDQVNTYLSRDAGLTWFQIQEGSHIYEIGDHGAIILMADDQKATDHILYSWDEGLTWRKLKFTQEPVEITNIITEPDNTSQRFIVYGETVVEVASKQVNHGVVISIDFTNLHMKQCVGSDRPNEQDSDYETWTPNGKISPNCLLGKKVTYTRRQRDACCFNGIQFERPTSVQVCTCTQEDWQCDLGYARKGLDGPCISLKGEEVSFDPPENCQGYYQISQGYRKVAGDVCEGGIDHQPIRIPCPMFSFQKFDLLYNGIVLCSIVGVFYFVFKNLSAISSLISRVLGMAGRKDDVARYMNFAQNQQNQDNYFDSGLLINQADSVAQAALQIASQQNNASSLPAQQQQNQPNSPPATQDDQAPFDPRD